MEKQIVVKKFGGTSVGDPKRINAVADLIANFQNENPDKQVVVVASAMAGETNRLLNLAKAVVTKAERRELDMLAATGEQVSCALLAMALRERGLAASSLLGMQAGITTDNNFNEAQILELDGAPVRRLLERQQVPIIAGFQGRTKEGDITTLGRGGSDISAVAVAAALKACACYIYTDVEGVYSADPRICPQAKILAKISHQEMLELASLGAKVFHPRSIYFAMRYEVPLVTLSSFKPGSGTWVVKESELMEHPLVTGITHRSDEARITLLGIPGGIKSLNKIFAALALKDISIDAITQTGFVDDLTNISFTVADNISSETFELCQSLVPELGAEGATIDRNIAKVSVVGIGIKNNGLITAKVFSTLADNKIEVQMIATSELRISVVIPRKYAELAVRELHRNLVEFGGR